MSEARTLHRALLHPFLLVLLRAAGFHSTKPSVLDALTDITERYLLLLASTTAAHAVLNHNDPVPGVTDVRMALGECGVLLPGGGEEWEEIMRMEGGGKKRKRDTEDVDRFTGWIVGQGYKEVRRVAGMEDPGGLGVGGGGVRGEDFLAGLRRKLGKGTGGDERLEGTVLGLQGRGREVVVEGGKVGKVADWRPRMEVGLLTPPAEVEGGEGEVGGEERDARDEEAVALEKGTGRDAVPDAASSAMEKATIPPETETEEAPS